MLQILETTQWTHLPQLRPSRLLQTAYRTTLPVTYRENPHESKTQGSFAVPESHSERAVSVERYRVRESFDT